MGVRSLSLGDTNRFRSLGELVYVVYQELYRYNHSRIHSSLNMPPRQFRQQFEQEKVLELVSKEMGS